MEMGMPLGSRNRGSKGGSLDGIVVIPALPHYYRASSPTGTGGCGGGGGGGAGCSEPLATQRGAPATTTAPGASTFQPASVPQGKGNNKSSLFPSFTPARRSDVEGSKIIGPGAWLRGGRMVFGDVGGPGGPGGDARDTETDNENKTETASVPAARDDDGDANAHPGRVPASAAVPQANDGRLHGSGSSSSDSRSDSCGGADGVAILKNSGTSAAHSISSPTHPSPSASLPAEASTASNTSSPSTATSTATAARPTTATSSHILRGAAAPWPHTPPPNTRPKQEDSDMAMRYEGRDGADRSLPYINQLYPIHQQQAQPSHHHQHTPPYRYANVNLESAEWSTDQHKTANDSGYPTPVTPVYPLIVDGTRYLPTFQQYQPQDYHGPGTETPPSQDGSVVDGKGSPHFQQRQQSPFGIHLPPPQHPHHHQFHHHYSPYPLHFPLSLPPSSAFLQHPHAPPPPPPPHHLPPHMQHFQYLQNDGHFSPPQFQGGEGGGQMMSPQFNAHGFQNHGAGGYPSPPDQQQLQKDEQQQQQQHGFHHNSGVVSPFLQYPPPVMPLQQYQTEGDGLVYESNNGNDGHAPYIRDFVNSHQDGQQQQVGEVTTTQQSPVQPYIPQQHASFQSYISSEFGNPRFADLRVIIVSQKQEDSTTDTLNSETGYMGENVLLDIPFHSLMAGKVAVIAQALLARGQNGAAGGRGALVVRLCDEKEAGVFGRYVTKEGLEAALKWVYGCGEDLLGSWMDGEVGSSSPNEGEEGKLGSVLAFIAAVVLLRADVTCEEEFLRVCKERIGRVHGGIAKIRVLRSIVGEYEEAKSTTSTTGTKVVELFGSEIEQEEMGIAMRCLYATIRLRRRAEGQALKKMQIHDHDECHPTAEDNGAPKEVGEAEGEIKEIHDLALLPREAFYRAIKRAVDNAGHGDAEAKRMVPTGMWFDAVREVVKIREKLIGEKEVGCGGDGESRIEISLKFYGGSGGRSPMMFGDVDANEESGLGISSAAGILFVEEEEQGQKDDGGEVVRRVRKIGRGVRRKAKGNSNSSTVSCL
ncbi:hypothetical protein DFH27DRAFT_612806 [Peziza echinospora]|nr:hypothetical protein DFH27DRAFT_612806 [Peziza echinospora]